LNVRVNFANAQTWCCYTIS